MVAGDAGGFCCVCCLSVLGREEVEVVHCCFCFLFRISLFSPLDYSEKTQTEVVWARHTIIWTGQDYPTGNSSRRKTKRQTEETMGRQHQRVDWPSMEHRTTES